MTQQFDIQYKAVFASEHLIYFKCDSDEFGGFVKSFFCEFDRINQHTLFYEFAYRLRAVMFESFRFCFSETRPRFSPFERVSHPQSAL